MLRIVSLIVILIFALPIYANKHYSIDSLFNVGVELYSTNNYKNALRSFLKCDSILKSCNYIDAKRDSIYVRQWIAGCYFKLHHYKKAIDYNIHSFGYEPIDKNLTVESDSLADLATIAMSNSQFENAITLLNKVSEIEKSNIGDNWCYINSLFNLYICHANLGHAEECSELFKTITDLHNIRYGRISPIMYWTYSNEGYRRLNTTLISSKDDVLHVLRPLLEAALQYNLINHVGFSNNYHLFSPLLENEDLKRLNACISYMLIKLSEFESNDKNQNLLKSVALSFYRDADTSFIEDLRHSISSIKYDFEETLAASLLKNGVPSDDLFGHTWLIKNRLSDGIAGMNLKDISDFSNTYRHLIYSFILTNREGCHYRNGLLVNFVKYIDGFDNALQYILSLVNSNQLAYADFFTAGLCSSEKLEDNSVWEAINSQIHSNIDGQRDYYLNRMIQISGDFDYAKNHEFLRLQKEIINFNGHLNEEDELKLEQYCNESGILFPMGFVYYKKSLMNICSKNYDQALCYAEKALQSFNHDFKQSNLLTYAAYKLLAIVNMYATNDEHASLYFKEAVNILEKYKDFHSELSSIQALYISGSFTFFKNSGDYDYITNDRVRKEFEDFDNPLSDNFSEPAYCKDADLKDLYENELLSLTDYLIPFQKHINEWGKAYNNSWIIYSQFSKDKDWIDNSIYSYSLGENIRPEWIDDLCWYSHFGEEDEDLSNLLDNGCNFFRKFLKTCFRKSDASTREKTYTAFYQRREFSKIIEDYKYRYMGNPMYPSRFYRLTLPYLAVQHPNSKNLGCLYNGLLIDKGILLSTERELNKIILNCGNDSIISLYQDYIHLQSEVDSIKSVEDAENIKSRLKYLENSLLEKSEGFGDFTKFLDYSWVDIYNRLKDNQVAVEFFEIEDQDATTLYALLLYKDCVAPKLIALTDFNPKSQFEFNEIYNTIWKPVLNCIPHNINSIYFSPCNSLHTIPIETSFVNNIDSKNSIFCYRLSSTRELLTDLDNFVQNGITLYGGIKYDTPTSALIEDSKKYVHRGLDDIYFDDNPEFLNLRNGVNYLPGTKNEILNILSLCNSLRIKNCSLFTDSLATEASFKSLNGERLNIIHIATHGFYFSNKEARRINFSSPTFALQNNIYSNEDLILSRSGLLFSGANNALMGNCIDGIDNGILTAREISSLDFSNVKFIVLSACQTGLGEITGDGVFGLQRGFKKAGANSLLMSLWKVDDRATQLLMTKFYEYLLAGKSKLESLTLAQKYVREYEEEVETSDESNMTASQKRRNQRQGEETETEISEKIKVKPFADPKYWAAFILLDALD